MAQRKQWEPAELDDEALLQFVHGVNISSAANRVNIVFDTEYDHPWKREQGDQ